MPENNSTTDQPEILEADLHTAAVGEAPAFRKTTDLGNAERLADQRDGELLWVYGMGWLYWDGARWRRDESNRVLRLAADTVRSIYSEQSFFASQASNATDDSERDKWANMAKVAWTPSSR